MDCVVCGQKGIGRNHKCSPEGIKKFNRSTSAKNAMLSLPRRYGVGISVGGKISDGSFLVSLAGGI